MEQSLSARSELTWMNHVLRVHSVKLKLSVPIVFTFGHESSFTGGENESGAAAERSANMFPSCGV